MRFYYYHRDQNGHEISYRIENELALFEDFQRVIWEFTPKDETPIVEIYKACQFGQAKSFLEFVEKDLLYSGEADANWVVAALIGEVKYGYPFAVIDHVLFSRVEVCAAKDIPWESLILELGISRGFQVGPLYFAEVDIDSEKAYARGYDSLVELLEKSEKSK